MQAARRHQLAVARGRRPQADGTVPRLVRHWGAGAQRVGVAHRAESHRGRRGLNAALGV